MWTFSLFSKHPRKGGGGGGGRGGGGGAGVRVTVNFFASSMYVSQ